MFRHYSVFAGLLVMALAAGLLVAHPAAADQQGWPLNQGSSNRYTEGSFGSGPTYAPPTVYAPVYTPAVAAPATPQTAVQSFYPSAAAEQYGTLSTPLVGNRPVRINVSVPANAQVTFNEARTMQRGANRAFVSPPVAPGQEYYYDVTAAWQQDGRAVTRTQRIAVHAGDVVNVTF